MIKILLVEDDKAIIENLTEYLTTEGYEVKSATGQTEALTLVKKEHFDLVLLDISLPDGNGFAICKAIKSEIWFYTSLSRGQNRAYANKL